MDVLTVNKLLVGVGGLELLDYGTHMQWLNSTQRIMHIFRG